MNVLRFRIPFNVSTFCHGLLPFKALKILWILLKLSIEYHILLNYDTIYVFTLKSTSIICSECGKIWAFIHTHSSTISLATFSANSFFSCSVPLTFPQNPSLLLWACLVNALAPTVNFGGFFSLFSSSSANIH